MKPEELALVLSGVQTLVIVLSFGGLIWQLKQVVHGIRQDAYSRAIEDYSQMSHYLLEKPHLNKYFYAHNSPFNCLTVEEQDAYNYIAFSFALFERIYLLSRKAYIDPEIWASWDRWLTDSWFRATVFSVFWENEREYFTQTFARYVDEQYRLFDADLQSRKQTTVEAGTHAAPPPGA